MRNNSTGSSTLKYGSPSPTKACIPVHNFSRRLFRLTIGPSAERQQFDRNIAATLSKSLRTMLTHTSSEQGRAAVPPITNSDVSPFPLKIAVRVGGVELS